MFCHRQCLNSKIKVLISLMTEARCGTAVAAKIVSLSDTAQKPNEAVKLPSWR